MALSKVTFESMSMGSLINEGIAKDPNHNLHKTSQNQKNWTQKTQSQNPETQRGL